ncbi:MAG: fumarylacetoacetate hydrolase family protein [Ilumatobacteraceae bacterium]|nr:fumarylacetoacetate hydrolase family protein [Ilumatobacteraceae bacterium]
MAEDDAPGSLVVDPPAPVTLPVRGRTGRFPVHRVFCVGRNYAEHAVEMGHDPDREPPFFFEKAPSCVLPPGVDVVYPPRTTEVHHEIEFVVAIGRTAAAVTADAALDHVYGYAVGLDMTRRDLQAAAKASGRPWDAAKSFDGAAPMSPVIPATVAGHVDAGSIVLEVDGDERQRGDLAQMIWRPAEIIAELSALVVLRPGDLIMTGTPAGVGSVHPGDRLHGRVDGVAELDVNIIDP